jgi:hypothetical protein
MRIIAHCRMRQGDRIRQMEYRQLVSFYVLIPSRAILASFSPYRFSQVKAPYRFSRVKVSQWIEKAYASGEK